MKLIDDIGREVNIPAPPQRILSLCPSITETICELGCCNRLIGITDYCIHPNEELMDTSRVGGPKTLIIDKWKSPWMAAGKSTFIDSMMSKTGFKNIIGKQTKQRYPIIDDLRKYEPGIVLLPSEPYHFKENDRKEIQGIFPKSTVILVGGEAFCWYGSRMLKSAGYFVELKEKIKGELNSP